LHGAPALPVDEILAKVFRPGGWRERLRPFVTDTSAYLLRRMDEGAGVLMEGAQGALLDIDHGTYPFVTSSSCTAGGACTGLGVPPTRIDVVLGVFKAYSTRVGGGPFPTELVDATGETIRRRGNEYGTSTGRPRRCGWFDAVAARHAVRLNGIESIALTLLDVLDEFDAVRICTGYRNGDGVLTEMPADVRVLSRCQPVYEDLPGWRVDLQDRAALADFPARARAYMDRLAELLDVEVAIVSTGPERRRSIVRDDSRFWHALLA
jgi:adenylosuccinate synthase